MKNYILHQPNKSKLTPAILAMSMLLLGATGNSVQAQVSPGGNTSLRNPLIPGAASFAPFTPAMEGAPPPIGDGMTAPMVTPGMGGAPGLLPWVPAVPVNTVGSGTSIINLPVSPSIETAPGQLRGMLAPYLPPPSSTPGAAPGILPTGINGFTPPAAEVDVQPQGGIVGNAPVQHWAGQRTRDLGRKQAAGFGNKLGAPTTDFGQKLSQLPGLAARGIKPSVTNDAPRAATYPGQLGASTNRQPNRAGAFATTNLYGNRQWFDANRTIRSKMTLADY